MRHSNPTRRRSAVLAAAVLLTALAAVMPPAAVAADNGEWAVVPTPPDNPGPVPRLSFFLEASPGGAVTDQVRVQNLTEAPLTFRIYGADAFNTEVDGGFGLRQATDEQTDIGAWTVIDVDDVTVPPLTQADIPFTIAVPDDATPGDHVGGIVALALNADTSQKAENLDVTVQRAVGARIYLRVNGPTIPGLALDNVTLASSAKLLPLPHDGQVEFELTNDGNIHIPPTIDVTTRGLFGHRLSAAPTPALDLLPRQSTRLATTVTGVWPFDIVTTTVTARGEGGVSATGSARDIVVHWPTLILLVIGLGLLVTTRRRRPQAATWRERSIPEAGQTTPPTEAPVSQGVGR